MRERTRKAKGWKNESKARKEERILKDREINCIILLIPTSKRQGN